MDDNRVRAKKHHGPKYHGLKNQGSTCYLNSVLQVLFMTKDFREAVKGHSSGPECIDRQLSSVFSDLEKRTAHTSKITKKLGISRVFEQRDAAEYLEKILSHTSPEASQIFQGHLIPRNKCSKCEQETNKGEPFWSLPLPLINSDSENYKVMDGIREFFSPSVMSGENQLYCVKCDAKADATIQFEMSDHPEVLTLLLKRFKFDYCYMKYVKIKCSVEVPSTLKIENQKYELYAFVEHSGELKFGHYTVTIKSQDDEKWYDFNDTTVTLLDYQPFQVDNSMISQSAYLLFYRKDNGNTANVCDIPVCAADTLSQDIGEVSPPGASKLDTGEENEPSGPAVTTKEKEESEVTADAENAAEGKVGTSEDESRDEGEMKTDVNNYDVGRQEKDENRAMNDGEDKDRSPNVDEHRDEGKMVADVKVEDPNRSGADEREQAGGSGKLLTPNNLCCEQFQDSGGVGDSKQDTSEKNQEHKQVIGKTSRTRREEQREENGNVEEDKHTGRAEERAQSGEQDVTKYESVEVQDTGRLHDGRHDAYKEKDQKSGQKTPLEHDCVEQKGDEEVKIMKLKRVCPHESGDGDKPNGDQVCNKDVGDNLRRRYSVEKEEEREDKREDEHAQTRGTPERCCGESVEDENSGQSDDVSQKELQEGLEQEIIEEGETGENKQRENSNIKEGVMGGVIHPVKEAQITHDGKSTKTRQARAEGERDPKAGDVNTLSESFDGVELDDSPSSEPQEHSDRDVRGKVGNDEEKKSSAESDVEKTEAESDTQIQAERDKPRKGRKRQKTDVLFYSGLHLSYKKKNNQSSESK